MLRRLWGVVCGVMRDRPGGRQPPHRRDGTPGPIFPPNGNGLSR